MASAAQGKDLAARLAPKVRAHDSLSPSQSKEDAVRFEIANLDFFYGPKQAVFGLNLKIPKNKVTALIGPSGCGKSTFLRTLNRMNETIRNTRVVGQILLDGQDILQMDVVKLRRRVGMVFQRPNPFPKSIYDNVAYGLRINGYQGHLDELGTAHKPRGGQLYEQKVLAFGLARAQGARAVHAQHLDREAAHVRTPVRVAGRSTVGQANPGVVAARPREQAVTSVLGQALEHFELGMDRQQLAPMQGPPGAEPGRLGTLHLRKQLRVARKARPLIGVDALVPITAGRS